MISGFKVGHYTDTENKTGLTVILPDKPVKAHYHICGGAPATHSLTPLESEHLVDHIDALVLTGGSAFGLGAISGALQWLSEQGRGFPTTAARVPIVPGAAIYDLAIGKPVPPRPEHAYLACQNAVEHIEQGQVGAGTGASIGKLFPDAQAMAGGVGYSELSLGDLCVCALAVVNCVGDVIADDGIVAAGAKQDGIFINTEHSILRGKSGSSALQAQNTTLVAVMTNAALDSAGLKRLAKMASAGLAKAIAPAFTPYDGDIVFALSNGKQKTSDLLVGTLATKAVAQAIRNSVGEQ